jgi:hypothetical protein
MIHNKILAGLFMIGLPLILLTSRPVSAYDNGRDHWDGNLYHDYAYGGRIDHAYYPTPSRTYEVNRYYRDPSNRYSDDYYRYGGDSRYGYRDFDCDHGARYYGGNYRSRYYGPAYFGGGSFGSGYHDRLWWHR